jgi:Ca-activated chloride channel family protein
MSFAAPIWLLGLALIPLILLALAVARRRARRYAVRFTALPALKAASGRAAAWRRRLPAALALAALAALVVAMAKPQRTVAVAVERASIMLVTDHSRSMQASDVKPDRLSAAQKAANAFVDRLPGPVRVGIVAYSDAPDAVQSPSDDHDATRRIVDAQVADGATATGDALQVALDTLTRQRQNGRRPPAAIILLSDGKTTVGRDPVEVAREAGRLKIPISTVALGTSDATVPNPLYGPPLSVAPDPETLRAIAKASGGQAFTAEDANRLSNIYRSLGSQLGTKNAKREVTAAFALGAIVLLLGAAAASMRLGGRLP